ncbi:hypothetical protein PFICI_08700 [Pestalotiopsis fici W106-1]|uniref:Carboxylic ester hydrolase n=1 Tax=Pestalotiopsis fici (strain W106-1 / CGMCC3.15140) TaxID=1229662 RepID=W3X0G2_PESFW|nr:uncharacterized protein PFICI_08700 [Pestalotiopsis fici W106-1]ETS78847.1 hypothetical protein PFICI_08700 [Pestalotiopsis fici W106-1]
MKAVLVKSLLLFGARTRALSGVVNCTIDNFQSILDSNGTIDQVVYAQHYAANSTFQNPNATTLQFASNPVALPATCAVQVNVTTEYQTHFSFGIFLPDDWNGRFFLAAQEGTNINWVDMAVGLRYRFASVATDTGHTGSDMNGFWYLNPESLNDWGWRANHLGTVYGKLLTEQFYDTSIAYSYMAGCSTGGRQSFKEAQMFPEDFDGIISACPAYWTTHQQFFNLKQTTFQYPSGSNHTIPTELFDLIGQEAIRQCDPQDGLVDGLISDPLGCNFDYHSLLCIGSSNTSSCLTGPQLDTLHKFYSDWKEDNDTFIYPHSLYGSEAMWNQSGIFGNGSISNIGSQYWYPQHILGLTNFTFENLTLDLIQWAEEVDPGQDQASDWDLSPFYERGGKLLHYHGHSDAIVPP